MLSEAQFNLLTITIILLMIVFLLGMSTSRGESSLKAKLSFIAVISCTVAWTIGLFFLDIRFSPEVLNPFARFTFVGPALVMSSFLVFIANFPTEIRGAKYIYAYAGIYSLIQVGLSMSDLVVENIRIENNAVRPNNGEGYPLYLILLVLTLVMCFLLAAYRYSFAEEVEKRQLLIIAMGFGTTVVLAIMTNLVIPRTTNLSELPLLGPYTLIPFIFSAAISVVRYKFLDIRVVVGTTLYYLILAILPYVSFLFSITILQSIFNNRLTVSANVFAIIVAMIFVYTFKAYDDFFKKQVNNRLINPGYDYIKVVDKFNKSISTEIEVSEIAKETLNTINQTLRPEFAMLKVTKLEDYHIERKHERVEKTNPNLRYNIDQETLDILLEFWKENDNEMLITDELKIKIKTNDPNISPLKEIIADFERRGIRLIAPITPRKETVGLLVLGEKKEGSLYTQQDTDLIDSLANTVGLAITRSLFYQEVKELNESLQQKVDEATSDLKSQNASLELALTRIEKIRQQEQDMLDVMGHELRTPITIVRNAISILKMAVDKGQMLDEEKYKSYVQKALEATKREMALIETMLAATKIDANRVQINLEKVDLIDVANSSLDAHGENAKDRGLELTFTKPEGEWNAYADRVRIQEILDNFVSNAVKYTMEGKVEIILDETDPNPEGEPMLRLRVKDTGIGIPEEDIEKLGRKFFRARQYIKESAQGAVVRPGGTGLGLYVSFELVQIMGGQVIIESEVGVGSTFGFTIPKHTGQEPQHIDQTFDSDDQIEQEIVKRGIREKSQRQELQERGKELEEAEWNQSGGKLNNAAAQLGYQKLNSANDIIAKINESKKYLEKTSVGSQESE